MAGPHAGGGVPSEGGEPPGPLHVPAEHEGPAWHLTALGTRLAHRPVLLIAGRHDTCAPAAVHYQPLVDAYRTSGCAPLEHHLLAADHDLSSQRVTLAAQSWASSAASCPASEGRPLKPILGGATWNAPRMAGGGTLRAGPYRPPACLIVAVVFPLEQDRSRSFTVFRGSVRDAAWPLFPWERLPVG